METYQGQEQLPGTRNSDFNTISSLTKQGQYQVALKEFENFVATKSYNFALSEIEKLVVMLPPIYMDQAKKICEKHAYELQQAILFQIAVLTQNEADLDRLIGVEKYFTFEEYKFIVLNGTSQQIRKYFENVKRSMSLFIQVKAYLSNNFLSIEQLAKRPLLFNFFCSQNMLKRVTDGPYRSNLEQSIRKWQVIVTDENYVITTEMLAFIQGCEDFVNRPRRRRLSPKNPVDIETMIPFKRGDLYLTCCSKHYVSFQTIKMRLLELEDNCRFCSFCKTKIPYVVYKFV